MVSVNKTAEMIKIIPTGILIKWADKIPIITNKRAFSAGRPFTVVNHLLFYDRINIGSYF